MKSYFYLLSIIALLNVPLFGHAQINQSNDILTETIEGLTIYPNPVSNGKIYITTKQNLNKDIEIFDVLGKKILSTSLFGNELNISKLRPGIYIIKIKENNNTANRKLIIK